MLTFAALQNEVNGPELGVNRGFLPNFVADTTTLDRLMHYQLGTHLYLRDKIRKIESWPTGISRLRHKSSAPLL